MATFGALRHPWHPLLHPYRTHVLCPLDLCPDLCLQAKVAGLLSPQNGSAILDEGEIRLEIASGGHSLAS
jgi:hypothetical protein